MGSHMTFATFLSSGQSSNYLLNSELLNTGQSLKECANDMTFEQLQSRFRLLSNLVTQRQESKQQENIDKKQVYHFRSVSKIVHIFLHPKIPDEAGNPNSFCFLLKQAENLISFRFLLKQAENLISFCFLLKQAENLISFRFLLKQAENLISFCFLLKQTLGRSFSKEHQYSVVTRRHILRTSIIPKAGDRINMTPLLSTLTYLIMIETPINKAQLIMDYIYKLSDIGHPHNRRKKNVAIGHLITYILEKKYNLIHPKPPNELPVYFTDASFCAFFGWDQSSKEEDFEGERRAPAPAPGANQNFYQKMVQHFNRLKTHFDQHFDQIENHLNQQDARYNEDMG
ncbi:hypothetical protein IEQ34_006092 [Dendrobium chrysotoxum]|uniref:Uncharacterized protein n=1 Tax=Dendrobium chrysotoxum TaxID=161865 RepID=A0AAV7GWU6_DENCH|nr:hypothetical protein IEQ34_006092 [Dendrobium chrysotoxum]